MGNISVSLPSDGETIESADYNTPINTIVNEFNGGIDNSNIASSAAIAGSKIADSAITAGKTAFGGNFTTSEVDTGFTWVDGKTIYKKTISTGALPNATTKTVAHSISGVSLFIDLYGFANNGTLTLPLPHSADSTNPILLAADATNITVQAFSNRSTYTTSYVTLHYVK